MYECKRIVLNMKLRALCQRKGVEFLEYEPKRDRLARDQLHLNACGQDELGSMIFKHCINFLL